MKLGFIGLGIMGKPMALNLLKAGYELCVFDRKQEAVDELRAAGAAGAANAAEVAAGADAVLTMLPNSPQVREVVLENGVAQAMRPGSTLIDMSSINPMESRLISAELEKLGVAMLDAPVSGGEPGAIAGTLSFMVGGKQEVFDRFRTLLLHMGGSAVLCGPIGAGNVTKLSNQIIVAGTINAVSEALMLGQMAGVSPEAVFQAIRGGLAGSRVLENKAPMMIAQNFKPGFKIDLHIKDLQNVLDAAAELGLAVPVTELAMDALREVRQEGGGGLDHSAMVKHYEKLSGQQLHA